MILPEQPIARALRPEIFTMYLQESAPRSVAQ